MSRNNISLKRIPRFFVVFYSWGFGGWIFLEGLFFGDLVVGIFVWLVFFLLREESSDAFEVTRIKLVTVLSQHVFPFSELIELLI